MATDLERARECCAAGRWLDGRALLESAKPEELEPDDIQLLAIAAGLTGDEVREGSAWERAHLALLERGEHRRAARCAFWLGIGLVNRGRHAPAMGWFQRGQRVLDDAAVDGPEHGLFLVPAGLQQLRADPGVALTTFDRVLAVGAKFDDREVGAFGRLGRGQALLRLGESAEALAMLDEALAAAMAGDVMPIGVGVIYCAVILECRRIFDLRRARDWTAVLGEWCDRQQGLVPFRGQCLVHRSEVAQVDGDWDRAWSEASSACDHFNGLEGDPIVGLAMYQRAELLRLRGDFDAAEESYRSAAEAGRRAEPGLQLLQLARGDVTTAAAGIRRCMAEATRVDQRARLLAAFIEIVLADGDVAAARSAARELADLAESVGSDQLRASAAQGLGAVLLAEGEPSAALIELGVAAEKWRHLGAPYEQAHVSLLRAEACEQLGDVATAKLESEAAVRVLTQLGAVADVVPRTMNTTSESPGGLSPRELEVLGLVSTGMTNRDIAERLVISEKTVARHVSNLFTKIGVNTRAAATAWAFSNGVAER